VFTTTRWHWERYSIRRARKQIEPVGFGIIAYYYRHENARLAPDVACSPTPCPSQGRPEPQMRLRASKARTWFCATAEETLTNNEIETVALPQQQGKLVIFHT